MSRDKSTTNTGNIFSGKVTKVTRGATEEVVTIKLDPSQAVELTFSHVPVPGPEAPCDETATAATAATTSGGAGTSGGTGGSSGGTNVGDNVQVVVPVPNAFIIKGN